MLAPLKRRYYVRYLSLPIAVAVVFVVVAKLVALQRADLITTLADRIAHRDTWEAVTAVRQLSSMPQPPVALLVRAATSSDREVAEEAQLSINKLLLRLQRQIGSKRSLAAAARQISALAVSLEEQKHAFATADYPWLANTTAKLLRLANRIPPPHSPVVAVHCDAIMAAVVPSAAVSGAGANRESGITPSSRDSNVISSASGDTRQATLQVHSDPPLKMTVIREADPTEPHSSSDSTPSPSDEDTPNLPRPDSAWSHPLLRILPAIPIHAVAETDPLQPASPSVAKLIEEPIGLESMAHRPYAHVDSRALLHQWLHVDGTAVLPIEQELTRRGFGRLSERIVQKLFTENHQERLRLVDDVLTEPGVDARPWLILLAEDPNADVRLLAVTIMATSNDAALLEKAWQVSLHDRDPRVAGLAGRLRERREATRRR